MEFAPYRPNFSSQVYWRRRNFVLQICNTLWLNRLSVFNAFELANNTTKIVLTSPNPTIKRFHSIFDCKHIRFMFLQRKKFNKEQFLAS